MFLDRGDELKSLQETWENDNFSFIVIYGRRRIGKTELIKEFLRKKPHIYFLAPQDTEEMQRKKLLEVISNHFNEVKPDLSNWDEVTDYLKDKLESKKVILTIDEFPYLAETNKSILSYFQNLLDTVESDSTLIICGSSVSFMESEVMGYKSPLYGRRSGQINLQPFNFQTSLNAINYPFQEAIRSYSITGGTPMYLLNFNYKKSLEENIKEKILEKTSFMHEEPEFLLRTELRNPKRYMSILEAIANGQTKPKRISNTTGIDPGPLSNYLGTLKKLRLIKREIPITAERKKSKRSLYKIADNFFKFWFRFIEPKKSWIEEAPEQVLKKDIMPKLNKYTSKTFEEICLEATWKLNQQKKLPNTYPKIGKWWSKESELDLLGLNENTNKALFGECKWTNKPIGNKEIKKLKKTAKKVKWRKKQRQEHYILFSKNGYKPNTEKSKNTKLYTLKDLKRILKN